MPGAAEAWIGSYWAGVVLGMIRLSIVSSELLLPRGCVEGLVDFAPRAHGGEGAERRRA